MIGVPTAAVVPLENVIVVVPTPVPQLTTIIEDGPPPCVYEMLVVPLATHNRFAVRVFSVGNSVGIIRDRDRPAKARKSDPFQ